MQDRQDRIAARSTRLLRRLTTSVQTLRSRIQSAPSTVVQHTIKPRQANKPKPKDGSDDEKDGDYWEPSVRRSSARGRGELSGRDFSTGEPAAKRRKVTRTYSGAGKAAAASKNVKQDISEELSEGFSQCADVTVDALLEANIKPILHPEMYGIFRSIVRAYRDILEFVQEISEREQPHKGVPSLREMVAAETGLYFSREDDEEERDFISNWVCDRSSGDFIMPFVRGQATDLLRTEILAGLFSDCGGDNGAVIGTRLVGVLIKLLLEYSALEDASQLFEACMEHNAEWRTFNTTVSLLTVCFRPKSSDSDTLSTEHTCNLNPKTKVCQFHPALGWQLCLLKIVLDNTERGAYLASTALIKYIDSIVATLVNADWETPSMVYYSNILKTYLVAAFGTNSDDVRLKKYIKRGRRHAYQDYVQDQSYPIAKVCMDQAERLLMATSMKLCTIPIYEDVQKAWEVDNNGELLQNYNPTKPFGSLVNTVSVLLQMSFYDEKKANGFWGGGDSYPTEAKLIFLLRAFSSISSIKNTSHPIHTRILTKILRIIGHLEKEDLVTVSIHVADHFAEFSRNIPSNTPMWGIKDLVALLMELASGIEGGEIVGSNADKTPLKNQTNIRNNLASLSMRLAIRFLTHREWASQDSWVAWASEVEKQGMAFGVASPVEKREKRVKQSMTWTRKEGIDLEPRMKPKFRWEEGLDEFVAVGFTPIKRTRRTSTEGVSYAAPDLKTLTEGLLSDDDEAVASDGDDSDFGEGGSNQRRATKKTPARKTKKLPPVTPETATSAQDTDGWDNDTEEEQESPISSASSSKSARSVDIPVTPAPRSVTRKRVQLEVRCPPRSADEKGSGSSLRRSTRKKPVKYEESDLDEPAPEESEEEEEEDGQSQNEDDDNEAESSDEDDSALEDELESKAEEEEEEKQEAVTASPSRYSFRKPSLPASNTPSSPARKAVKHTPQSSRLGNLPTPLKPTPMGTPARFSLAAEARLLRSRNTPNAPLFSSSLRNRVDSPQVPDTPAPAPRKKPSLDQSKKENRPPKHGRPIELDKADEGDYSDSLASIPEPSTHPSKRLRSSLYNKTVANQKASNKKPTRRLASPPPIIESWGRSLRNLPKKNYNENTLLPSFTPRKRTPSPPRAPAPQLNISAASLRTRRNSVDYKEKTEFSDDELNGSPFLKKKIVYQDIKVAGHMLRKRKREVWEEVDASASAESEDEAEKERNLERLRKRKKLGLRVSGHGIPQVADGELSEDELSMLMG